MSSFTVKTAERNCPYVGVPAFVSRAFRHNSIYVRTDRIKTPADLKGKRIGLPEYQLTACVWARIILEDDHGIKPSDVIWVRGGIDDPSRPEKITIKLPPGVRLENAPEGRTISELLESGEIDAFIAPRVPSLAGKHNPNIGWLFPDPIAAGRDYYKRTGIFPIMHVTGIRRTLVEQHPWLPAAVLKAFEQSKTKCLDELEDTATIEMHAAVRRGAAQGRARADGPRFLVLRARAQPQGAGDVPAPPPCAGTVRRRLVRPRSCSIPRRTRASRFESSTASRRVLDPRPLRGRSRRGSLGDLSTESRTSLRLAAIPMQA